MFETARFWASRSMFNKKTNKIVSSDKNYLNHPAYWDMLCDSIDMVSFAKIPYSFETVLMQENFPKLEEIARNMSAFGVGKLFNGF